jgi:hypothetical protein
MTQEEKLLLLKDLCARLPYKVKVYNKTFKEPTIQTLYGKISDNEFLMEETYTSVGIDGDDFGSFNKRHYTGYVDFIKPYLQPMSSMTEEELKEFKRLKQMSVTVVMPNGVSLLKPTYIVDLEDDGDGLNHLYDWLNSHHFDYRGLIEKGLALEAPKDMYK